MPRPRHCRKVACLPQATFYKPRGIPLALLKNVTLTVDELEAIRLADFQGLYQERAAEEMNISRQTFGRIIESAHTKIADALVNGKALSIQGGSIRFDSTVADVADLTASPHRLRRRGGPSRHGCGPQR